MHILIIPSWYKSAADNMLGSFFEEQARALQAAGQQVGIIYPDLYPPSAFFNRKNELKYFVDDNGLPTYSKNIFTFFPVFRSGNYMVHGKMTDGIFKDYIKQYGKPDIIHSHSATHAGIAAMHLSKKYNIPHIITEHLTTIATHSIKHPQDYKITREVFLNADRAIVVSNIFKDILVDALRLHPDYFQVVHNMVSDLFFENLKVKTYNHEENFIFLTNSFLKERKNHKLLFDAFHILLQRKHKVKLRVGGYGPEENDLRAYVKKLAIEDHVEFTGQLGRTDVKEEINNCHAFVLPSLFETFGIVLIESLACGRPIVSTDSKGPRDIINESNGILINHFDAASLADGMQSVMLNYSSYNQLKISEDCRANFSQQRITKKLISIYEEVLIKRQKGQLSVDEREKKDLLITFDYELFLGKRSGRVQDCMLDPTNSILKILKAYKVKAIFFVDTTYLLRLEQLVETNKKCKMDFESIKAQLEQMINEGHYIYPHIHPHWLDAVYDEQTNQWNVENAEKYRFNKISDAERTFLFDGSVKVLRDIILPHKSDYFIDAFRAGGWSIQPFSDFKQLFINHDFKYEFSVLDRAYQFTDAQYFDFSNRPDKLIYRFEDDVCVENFNGRFLQFVNSTVELENIIQQKNRVISKLKRVTGMESNNIIGQGQAPAKKLNEKPQSDKGFPASGANRFYLSIDLLTATYLPTYQNFLSQNYYMHFVSHPKMMKPESMVQFEIFLKYAFDNFTVETDFKKMIP